MHLDLLVVPDELRLPPPSSMLSTKSSLMFTSCSMAAFLTLAPVCFTPPSTTGLSFTVTSTLPSSPTLVTSCSLAMAHLFQS